MSHSKPLEPLNKAKKIQCKEKNIIVPNGNIAAIDFGTTSVSIAYTTRGSDSIQMLVLDEYSRSTRVPNSILLFKKEKMITVKAFGEGAQKTFSSLRSNDLSGHIYFERIKMLMKREKNLDRQTLVESFSGEKFYLVEVIAFILKYLQGLLISHLSIGGRSIKTTDFDWVITVPAIWDARGKKMMREAAYLAGLLIESGGITEFTGFSYVALPPPNETNSEKLYLALEPESAALYSQEKVGNDIKGAGSFVISKRPTNYMVIDIGGGTVDITAHKEVSGGSINVVNVPTGNAWGGTQINEAFSQMLQKLIDDPEFKKFLASGDHSQQMSALNEILYREFEGQKILFGQDIIKAKEIAINLAGKFAKFYEKKLEACAKQIEGVQFEDDKLYLSKDVVESRLFGPALDGIISCALKAIEDNECKADTFYLVGGFGGCKYVHEKVKAEIEKLYQPKGCQCYVVVPIKPALAIATGAIMWRKYPGKITTRRANATYGIKVSDPFDVSKHDRSYRYYDPEEHRYRCKSVFKVFLLKGELISSDVVMTTDLMPLSSENEKMIITIYTTPHLGVQYVEDKNGKEVAEEIGKLVINIPNPDGLPVQKRRVDITMDFSGTEIQAKAKYRLTGEEVDISCNFLSAKS